MVLLAKENLSVPGLYYDEAVFAGMAKDFLTGQIHGHHMPGHETIEIFRRPFPVFIQIYLGALKSWMLIPAFRFFGYSVLVLRADHEKKILHLLAELTAGGNVRTDTMRAFTDKEFTDLLK